MKCIKLFSFALMLVFAVSINSEAGFKARDLKKKLTKDKKESKEKKYDYVMKDGGNMENDIKKILPPKSRLNHRITEGQFGPADGSKGNILIVPFKTGNSDNVQVMLLIPGEKGKYNKMMLGEIKFGTKAAANVESVFFDQGDKDPERELFLLCGYASGELYVYETAVFNWKKNKFERIAAMESKIKNLYPAINVRRSLRAMEAKSDIKRPVIKPVKKNSKK